VKYFVLVMLLSAGPVLAGSAADKDLPTWLQENPDDIECVAKLAGFTVVYTYSSEHPPASLPVKGLTCFTRNYEAQAEAFVEISKHFDGYWKTVK